MKPEYRGILIFVQVPDDPSLDCPSVFHIFIEFLEFLNLVNYVPFTPFVPLYLFYFIFCASKALP